TARHLGLRWRGWRLLGASALSWAIGELIWCYYDLVRDIEVPFPSLADAGFLLAVPLAVGGLLTFPGASVHGTSRLRSGLDGLLVGSAVFFVSWTTVLGAVYRSSSGTLLARAVSLAYPVSDVVIATLAIVLVTAPGPKPRASLSLVLGGLVAFAVADSSFAYLTATNAYGIGNALDTGWVAGYFLVALGAARAWPVPVVAPLSTPARPALWTILGPNLPLAVAGVTAVWRVWRYNSMDRVSQVGFALMVLVMATRQFTALYENLTLNRHLEAKVEQRTAELHHQAFHDGLTGLANRALFNQYLESAVGRQAVGGGMVGVLLIDLHNFKRVNDIHGVAVGDHLLRMVAARLQTTLRGSDKVARVGGDEFAVLVEGAPLEDGPERVAQRVLRAMGRPFVVNSRKIAVEATIGVSAGGAGQVVGEELHRDAGLALYAAKSKGGRCYEVYSALVHSVILDTMQTENELRLAIDRDELVVYYQPVVDLASGSLKGVEALVRWQHPVRGLVSPDKFIPLAERTGMIIDLGSWVLRRACNDVQALQPDGAPIALSVNLSARQLDDEALVATVTNALAESDLEPSLLTLEVTETVIMADVPHAIEVLTALRELGVQIAVDDFGTGYSSLAALRHLPVNTLKIDRSFVTDLARDQAAEDLTRRTLQLAADFHLRTVAEGVERPDQLEILRQLGCHAVQGYLFARPQPLASLVALLSSGLPDPTGLVDA
ncbi:MAG TPA: bifunctional diguanylate cyclase/phosphodiesterase, partial [Acidimicrobiales bacterium]|nr:bifunctional diguanylate cyclase/phosphodiesterase [Acidimicrobiales bacterium]